MSDAKDPVRLLQDAAKSIDNLLIISEMYGLKEHPVSRMAQATSNEIRINYPMEEIANERIVQFNNEACKDRSKGGD
jgi:hypothetical protein